MKKLLVKCLCSRILINKIKFNSFLSITELDIIKYVNVIYLIYLFNPYNQQ